MWSSRPPSRLGQMQEETGRPRGSTVNEAWRGGDTLAFAKRKDHSEAKEPAEGVSASPDHTDGLEAQSGRRLSGRLPVPGEGGGDGPAAPGGSGQSKAGGWSLKA